MGLFQTVKVLGLTGLTSSPKMCFCHVKRVPEVMADNTGNLLTRKRIILYRSVQQHERLHCVACLLALEPICPAIRRFVAIGRGADRDGYVNRLAGHESGSQFGHGTAQGSKSVLVPPSLK